MEPIIGKGATKDSESLLDQIRGYKSVIDDHILYKTAGEAHSFH